LASKAVTLIFSTASVMARCDGHLKCPYRQLRRRVKRSIIRPEAARGRSMIEPLGGPAYWLPYAIAFVVAYLIGSVPFGVILTRLGGAGDLRQIGSGNIGATNVLRTGRKGLALATLVFDILKGALPVWLGYRFFGPDIAVVAGLGAVVGHCFPVWLKFRGGKGVATACGVVATLTPLVAVIVLALFIAIAWLTRYVSLASILAAAAAGPVAFWLGHFQPGQLYLALALLIVIKHAGNIRRLLRGEESKLGGASRPTSG
jgi:acyl phosphate:glycerol-3-phosphate acyltransferase